MFSNLTETIMKVRKGEAKYLYKIFSKIFILLIYSVYISCLSSIDSMQIKFGQTFGNEIETNLYNVHAVT
jgi:hypothetical protein